MDLAEFVRKTLVQVARGVKQAHAEVQTLGVSPNSDHDFMVTLEVVVAVSDGPDAEGNNIKVVSVDDSSVELLSSAAHRISLQVPFALSVDDPIKKKMQIQQAKTQAALDQRIERFTSPFS